MILEFLENVVPALVQLIKGLFIARRKVVVVERDLS